MTDLYAVIGNPIAHSRSPRIHAEFARQTGEDLVYETLLAPREAFRATVDAFRARGGKGLNVTVPFKLEAYHLATDLTPRALEAGAVNTLKFEGSRALGDNTDGVGLTRDITQNLGCPIAGRRVLLLGAGGAAHGVLVPLLRENPEVLIVANRTPQKAVALVRFACGIERIAKLARRVLSAASYPNLQGKRFDIVINATAASLEERLPPLPEGVFAPGALAYDMVYGKGLTPFLRFAAEQGAGRLADGLGMLVEQAAESFFLWRAVRPETAPVIDLLRG